MTMHDIADLLNASEHVETGNGISEAEIRAAENKLGLTFPTSYREYLGRFGYLAISDLELFGLGHGIPAHLDLVRVTTSERSEVRPYIPTQLLPLCNDGSGSHYCLDASVGPEAPVVFWDHEAGENQIPAPIAPNFIEWLGKEVSSRAAE